MNKSEIIRKTALIAGAPEAEASLFFEIFIRSAADILNPGDVIKINDLGFLHYKIGKAGEHDAKDPRQVYPGSGWVDLVIYSDAAEKIDAENPACFVVPAKYEYDFAEIDAPFSLSFNKPVIQLLRMKDAYFIPQTYNELIRLLESKAARLLVNAKVIKNDNKENEVFIPGVITADQEQMHFEQEEKPVPDQQKEESAPLLSPEAQKEFDELTEALEAGADQQDLSLSEERHEEQIVNPETEEQSNELKQEEQFNELKQEVQESAVPDEQSFSPEERTSDQDFQELKEEAVQVSEHGKSEEYIDTNTSAADEPEQVHQDAAADHSEETLLTEAIAETRSDEPQEEYPLSSAGVNEKEQDQSESADLKSPELNEEEEQLLADQKKEGISEPVEETNAFTGESDKPEVEPAAEQASGTEDQIKEEKSAEKKEIDKLLSKASFGANIPWKFNDVNIIEPGKEAGTEEELQENLPPPEEEKPASENTEISIEESRTAVTEEDAAPAEIKESEEPRSTFEEDHPMVFDESLSLRETEKPDEEEKVQEGEYNTEEEGQKAEEDYKSPEDQTEEITGSDKYSAEKQLTESSFGEPEQEDYPESEPAEELPVEEGQEAPSFDESPVQPVNTEELSQTTYDEEEVYGKKGGDEPPEVSAEDNYEEVKPVKLKYDWKEGYLQDSDAPSVPEESKEEEAEEPEPDEDGYIEIKPGISKEKIDFLAESDEEEETGVLQEETVSGEDRAQKDLKDYISKIEEIDKETSHKRKSTTVLTLIIFLLFVGVGVYLYYQYIFKKNTGTSGKSVTVVVKNPETIERDFIIPVTYPYSKNENKENLYTQAIDSSVLALAGAGAANAPKTEPQIGTTTSVPAPPAKLENLGDYIYRLGNDYIVQIASFETQTRAEAQVASLKKANYDAYSEPVTRSDGSFYHRVMIRGFKSYEQARDFLK